MANATKGILVVGQPGAGKTTLASLSAESLTRKTGKLFVSLDNEDFGIRPETRVSMASALGFTNPDDPQFRRHFGYLILLDTMDSISNHLRNISMSIPDVIGLIHMPDKDPKSLIGGTPVFEKTIADYSTRGVQIIGIISITFESTDAEFVEVFRQRLQRGAEGSPQRELDEPKLAKDDLLLRRRFCQETAELYSEARLSLHASPEANAETLAAAIDSIL